MKVIGITVSKETAKRMIDEAPGDTVKIFYMNRDNYVHKETITKEKSEGKRLVDLAKDISYDDMEKMAKNGAKVLHDRCVVLAKKYGVKIIVKNTFNDEIGTIVGK